MITFHLSSNKSKLIILITIHTKLFIFYYENCFLLRFFGSLTFHFR
jgi:hypothetical protein